jgi:peptide/nickel transport system substrate-binding protein
LEGQAWERGGGKQAGGKIHQLQGPIANAARDLKAGKISRREFMARTVATGVGAPMALVLVNAIGMDGAAAQDALSERPSTGTDGQLRGAGGELSVRQWLAPDNLFMHHITDDFYPLAAAQVSSLIVEPLLSYAPDGSLLPTLVTEVPTRENGGLSDDLTTVTLNLRDDVLWSDEEPLIAEDVVWTWQWITESDASAWSGPWTTIQEAGAISPTQVQLIYPKPTLAWFMPLAGSAFGGILPSHVWKGKNRDVVNAQFGIEPVGTGPYKIEEFVPGDYILCSVNEHYREANKPWFATVRFQGGGDAASDAQAVLQNGDGDVASALLIDPEFLLEMESAGDTGRLIATQQTSVERIAFNFSDPNTEVDGERSSLVEPHPFLTDIRVRQAMAMAIDREAIASEIFGGGDLHPPARNILTGIVALESPNTSFQYDIDAANELLDDARWVRAGDTRTKDGIRLEVSYYTAAGEDNALVKRFRPRIQEAVKAGWEEIGIEVELGRLNGDEFFDASPENEHSYAHFYRDIQMWAGGATSPFPDLYFEDWYAGPDNRNVAQRANGWSGWNLQRYVNPEFDALFEELQSTIDPERAVELFILMNDLIVNDFVVVPLVARPDQLYAFSNRIVEENIGASAWEPLFWNIANWRAV